MNPETRSVDPLLAYALEQERRAEEAKKAAAHAARYREERRARKALEHAKRQPKVKP